MTTVRGWPGCTGGVLGPDPGDREDLAAYLAAGGYLLAGAPAQQLHDDLAARAPVRALRGRGGAWYPFWEKVTAVRAAAAESGRRPSAAAAESGPRPSAAAADIGRRPSAAAAGTGRRPSVVANGAEGEPLSVKDRYLMRHRPHLVLDGVALAAASVGATEAVLYVTDAESLASLESAVSEASGAGVPLPDLRLIRAQDTYVAGEASAAVRAIDTGIARPRDTDFRLAQVGVAGAPTLLANVETLARLARAVLPGPPDGESPLLLTVSGPDIAPSLIEVDYGQPVAELIADLTAELDVPQRVERGERVERAGRVRSVLLGGFFGGIVPVASGLRLTVESAAAHGGALGVTSLYILGDQEDPCAVAAAVAAYYAANNARQCRFCNEATADVAAALAGSPRPAASPKETVRQLTRWTAQLPGRGACTLPDGMATLVGSLLRHYPDRLAEYLAERQATPPAQASPGGQPNWSAFTVPVPRAASHHAAGPQAAGPQAAGHWHQQGATL
jgi:NADH:ubiquinone oxidoreductase subunit F (NADH-binding)